MTQLSFKMLKPCVKCGVVDRDPATGRCRACRRAYVQRYSKQAAEKISEAHRLYYINVTTKRLDELRAWRHGLSVGDIQLMRLIQGNRCDICGIQLDPSTREGEHIDHDHTSGRVRGLLCGGCNRGLGQFGDDIQRLLDAAAYLRRWS